MKRRNPLFETVSVTYKTTTKKTFPDYINGFATEPNENPIIFEYNYNRGDPWNLPVMCPPELFTDYFLHALTTSLAGALGVGTVGVGVTVADIAITLSGEAILADLGALIGAGQIGQVGTILATWLADSAFVGILGPAAAAAIIGYVVWCATKAYDTVGVAYQEYEATGRIQKQRVDTEGYYDEDGVWHWKWKGFKMRMAWNYAQQDVQVVTTSEKRNNYAHIYTTGIMPQMQIKPKYLEYFTIIEPLHSELIPEDD